MKEKYAFVHIPDASPKEIKELIYCIKQVEFPYHLVFIAGKKWQTIDKKELLMVLQNDKN